ncbi:MAG: 2,3-bisphosphoglycerate-dependent phosphoglycerate mutase [Fimbriimonadaceae bacterium]|jgi:broad specificity phosphatase PhoE|nr:2,3-bisphosphoglycerate-dependent phosphoglycerate mutase [Fimbriimonadaceae bacterium]
MRLYLVRHGQTAWNAEEKAQGHTDIPLDETGLRQASCLATFCEDLPIKLVLTSDLQRSLKTAEAVAQHIGARVESTPLLRERTFGEWEGLPYVEVGKMFGEAAEKGLTSLYEACPPGGESLAMAWNRVKAITERLATEPENTLVVSHGGVCALMLAQLIGGDLNTSRAFRFKNCAVTELHRRPDGSFQLIAFNDASHISGEEQLHAAAS